MTGGSLVVLQQDPALSCDIKPLNDLTYQEHITTVLYKLIKLVLS